MGPLQPAGPLGQASPGARGGGCCLLGETEVTVGDMASRTKPASLSAPQPNPPVCSGWGEGAAGIKNFLGCTPTPVLEVTEHSRKDRACPPPPPWLQPVQAAPPPPPSAPEMHTRRFSQSAFKLRTGRQIYFRVFNYLNSNRGFSRKKKND